LMAALIRTVCGVRLRFDERISLAVSTVIIAGGVFAVFADQVLGGVLLIVLGGYAWAVKWWRSTPRSRHRTPQTDEQYARRARLNAYLFGGGILILCVGVLAHDIWLREPSMVDVAAVVGIPLSAYLLYRVITFPGMPVRRD
jgi:hypothetical protein